MLTIALTKTERLTSYGAPACPTQQAGYRAWRVIEGMLDREVCDFAATAHAAYAHRTVNPLVPRPRAKHG